MISNELLADGIDELSDVIRKLRVRGAHRRRSISDGSKHQLLNISSKDDR
ncbi:hypothetical protein ACQPZ2_28780 [Nocardia pseudovaccinii]